MKNKTLPAYCHPDRLIESVDGVILHYVSLRNVDYDNRFDMLGIWDLFRDLNRERGRRERYMLTETWPDKRMYASAHVLIGRSGEVWQLLPFNLQAWHAGKSILNGRRNCNRWTLGVELAGTQDSGFSDSQYKALAALLVRLMDQYGFDVDSIAGHDAVRYAAIQAGEAKAKKYDPSGRYDGTGDNFDYQYLYELMAVDQAQLKQLTAS